MTDPLYSIIYFFKLITSDLIIPDPKIKILYLYKWRIFVKYLLLSFLAFVILQNNANADTRNRWFYVGENQATKTKFYIDKMSVSKTGIVAEAWIKAVFLKPKLNIKTMKSKYVFNCGGDGMFVKSAYAYSASGELLGGGEVEFDPEQIKSVVPESVDASLRDTICSISS